MPCFQRIETYLNVPSHFATAAHRARSERPLAGERSLAQKNIGEAAARPYSGRDPFERSTELGGGTRAVTHGRGFHFLLRGVQMTIPGATNYAAEEEVFAFALLLDLQHIRVRCYV